MVAQFCAKRQSQASFGNHGQGSTQPDGQERMSFERQSSRRYLAWVAPLGKKQRGKTGQSRGGPAGIRREPSQHRRWFFIPNQGRRNEEGRGAQDCDPMGMKAENKAGKQDGGRHLGGRGQRQRGEDNRSAKTEAQ